MMKKIICVFLTLALALSQAFALAEGGEADLGTLLGEALEQAGAAAQEAWGSVEGALSQTWDSASQAFDDAWGWVEEFAAEQGAALGESTRKALEEIRAWLNVTGDDALQALRGAFLETAADMDIPADEAEALWERLQEDAGEYGVTPVTAGKLALAFMGRTWLNPETKAGRAAAEYIEETMNAWLAQSRIQGDASAGEALERLDEALKDAAAAWVCPACGEACTGNFCPNCGEARPE